MSDSPFIKDNPSNVKLRQTMHGAHWLGRFLRLLTKLGWKNEAVIQALEKMPKMKEVERLLSLPDRFNARFSCLGWVAFESMNAEVIERAVSFAEEGKVEQAEEVPVDYFDEETIRFKLLRMKNLPMFQPRFDLAQRALEDYLAERYHASVPVVLLLTDGFVNEIEPKGFFAEGTDVTAWDSIAAHSSGVQELAKLLGTIRRKTTTEPLTIPYRHGILHGRDLGYANKLVAAKTWATLFAVGDWAVAIQAGKKCPKEEEAGPTVWESLKQITESAQQSSLIESWKPRSIEIGATCSASGSSSEYPSGSPERTLVEFLEFWTQKNYGKMAGYLKKFDQVPHGKLAGQIRSDFSSKTLLGFELLSIEDCTPSCTNVEVRLALDFQGRALAKQVTARLTYEDGNRKMTVYPAEGGNWKIMPGSFDTVIYMV